MRSQAHTLRILFNSKLHIVIAAATSVALWTLFNILDGLVLLTPVVTFYYPIPGDAIPGFVLSILTASLAGIVTSMNVYLFTAGQKIGKSSLISGSTLGTISSVCASCSSVGFYAATTFGVSGVAASSLLSIYQTPLRVVAIAILVVAYFSAHQKVSRACKLAT